MSVLNPFERSTAGLWSVVEKRLHAFRPNGAGAQSAMVTDHCSVSSVRGDIERFQEFLKLWGPLKTHAIATVLAPLNNDREGTDRHIRGFGLHFVTFFDRPFGLTEEEHFALVEGNPDEMVETLATHLIKADLSSVADSVRRAFELFVYPSHAVLEEDQKILEFIGLVQNLGSKGSDHTSITLSELDPIGSDQKLKGRYAQLRSD